MAHGPDVTTFLSLLIVVAVVAATVQYIRIPYSVALVLAGLVLAVAPGAPHFQLTPSIILTVFLPVLLFHGAYNLDFDELRATIVPVTLLALPGVAATAGLVGLALHLTTGLSWPEALLFGAIVSATDPVAVLAIFGEVAAPSRLSTLVSAESLFNDGTALVLFVTIGGVATAQTVGAGDTVVHFAVAVLGGLVLGAIVAVVGGTVLMRIDDALLETTITFIMAYGGYLLAVRLGSSGPLETVTAGLLFGSRGHRIMAPATRMQARATWEFLDFLANSLLFLLMGLAVGPIARIAAAQLKTRIWWPLVVAVLAVLVARVVIVLVVRLAMRHHGDPLPPGWSTVLVWAGLRGGVSLAAALSIPSEVGHRDLLITLTFGIVLFTLIAQGTTTRWLLDRLNIGADIPSDDAVVLDVTGEDQPHWGA